MVGRILLHIYVFYFCVFSVPQPECDPSLCAIYETHCPNDSVVAVPSPLPGDCCPPPPVCSCQPCSNHDLLCSQGQLKVTEVKGTGQPGSCCDIFDCVDKGKQQLFQLSSNISFADINQDLLHFILGNGF